MSQKLSPRSNSKTADMQVLVVNSSAGISELLKNIFNMLGFKQVVCLESAAEAMQFIKEARIHVIITEWDLQKKMLPTAEGGNTSAPRTGSDLVKLLRRQMHTPNAFIPAIVLANQLTTDDAIRARDSGVNGLVLKPLEAAQLCSTMQEVIGKPRMFITSNHYRGPCRRRAAVKSPVAERRQREIRVVRYQGEKK